MILKKGQKVRFKKNIGSIIKSNVLKDKLSDNNFHYDSLIKDCEKYIELDDLIIYDTILKENWYGDIPIKSSVFYLIRSKKKGPLFWGPFPECFIEDISDKINKILEL